MTQNGCLKCYPCLGTPVTYVPGPYTSPKDKYPKKRRPDCLRPYATFHFAQTNGGKSEHEATLSYGSVAHSLNRVPQAQTDGRERTACEIWDEIGLKSMHLFR